MKKLTPLLFLAFAILLSTRLYAQTGTRDNAGLQGDAGAVSGFFETSNPVNYPAGASSWWHLLDVRHSNPGNNYAMQFAGYFWDQNLWFRKTSGNPAQPWSKVAIERTPVTFKMINFEGNVANSNQSHNHYGIYQESGGWTHPYPDLVFNYHTGMKFVGYHAYGGMRFYGGYSSDATPTDEVLSLANGDLNVRVSHQLFVADKIGIGTENTGSNKLSVNGTIRAKEIKVEATPWPDYVFNSSYQLPNLKDTEQFIRENKHLPEIPSATEVEKEGVNLGEMNAKLLKKIEELTLYLIEKDKQVDALEKRVGKLENKNGKKLR